MTTERNIRKIALNLDLSAVVAGFESAQRATPAHHIVARHYSSPLLLGPPTSELLLELVMHMFTEEEAELVQYLKPLRPRTAVQVARQAGRPVVEVQRILDHLALRKMVILGFKQPRKYTLLPILPGTFEMALMTPDLSTRNAWHQKFAALFERLWETEYFADYPGNQKIAPVRYVPVGGVVKNLNAAWPSERLEQVLEPFADFAVGHCQCRLAMHLVDKGCSHSTENCVCIGPAAKAVIDRGLMRKISREEVIEIKRNAEQEGLVSFIINNLDPKQGSGSCSCCGCCCHGLRAVKQFSAPGLISQPHFVPMRRVENCKMCKKCIAICPMEAWTAVDKDLRFNRVRCIGCGLCVISCKHEALKLEEIAAVRPAITSQLQFALSFLPTYLSTSVRVWAKRLWTAKG